MTFERETNRHTRRVDGGYMEVGDSQRVAPWLSIITPVKDALSELERTWESLASQDLAGIEWLIVDSSTDGDEVPLFIRQRAEIPVTYIRQEPRGIFAAMNRGVTESAGHYVYFLNAGDTLMSSESLTTLRHALTGNNSPPWAYADVEMVDDQGRVLAPAPWDHAEERSRFFARGYFPCHQGTVVRGSVIRSLGGFDTSYVIGGDYDLFLRIDRLYPPTHLPFTLARFSPGGASSENWLSALREFHRARRLSLRPSGWAAARERVDTAWFGGKTALYRSLWAPGRPLHRAVRRIGR